MPYFVFRLRPFAMPEPLGEFRVFRDASAHAKSLRQAAGAGERDGRIKVMFADNLALAEDLLCQIRDPLPPGED